MLYLGLKQLVALQMLGLSAMLPQAANMRTIKNCCGIQDNLDTILGWTTTSVYRAEATASLGLVASGLACQGFTKWKLRNQKTMSGAPIATSLFACLCNDSDCCDASLRHITAIPNESGHELHYDSCTRGDKCHIS